MNDSRITLWTNPTVISADGTTNGPTLNLYPSGVAGSHISGAGPNGQGYGMRVQLVPTGTAFNAVVKVQESADGSTWYDLETLYVSDPVANLVGTKITIEAVVTPNGARDNLRLVIVTTNMSGESLSTKAWLTDVGHKRGITINYA